MVGLSALELVPKFATPDSFHIIVAGGRAGKFSSFMPCFGIGAPGTPMGNMSKPVHRPVEPVPSTVATATPPCVIPRVPVNHGMYGLKLHNKSDINRTWKNCVEDGRIVN